MLKGIITVVSSMGIGQVVHNIVECTTPESLSKSKKVITLIGGAAISSVLGTLSAAHIGTQIDDFTKILKSKTANVVEVETE